MPLQFDEDTIVDVGALVRAQKPFAMQVLLVGTADELPAVPCLEDTAPPVGAKSLSASISIALVGLADEVGRVIPEDTIAPRVGAMSLSASTAIALVGVSDDAPPIVPVDEFVTIISVEDWEAQVARTIGFEETWAPTPASIKLPGTGLRVLLRGLGLAPVYGSLAELAPSGITYVLFRFDASYPAGGYPLAPSALGFTTKALTFLPTASMVSSQGYFPVYDGANQTVRLFRAVAGQWVEPAAGTDLSRVVMDVAVAGY